MIKCAPKSFFLLQFYHVLPIRKVHSFVEVFEAGRSWAEGQSLGLREAAAAPDIPQYPIFDRQWTWQVYIEDVSTMSFLKCPIDSNTVQHFVLQSHINIQRLPRSSVVAKSGWASFKLSEGTCLGRSFLERRPPRFQCTMDLHGVLMAVMCKLLGTKRYALESTNKQLSSISICC